MNEQIRKFLNEEQDPKAVEKITAKLADLLMKNEEIGYIGVQKKPVTVFPDSIILTNKRIIICKPKNLGFSMDFVDYNWENVSHTSVNESILGSEFSFTTQTNLTISIDYIPKIQARKLYTFAKEQLDELKNTNTAVAETVLPTEIIERVEEIPVEAAPEIVEEMEAEEVTNFAEIMPIAPSDYREEKHFAEANAVQEESTSTPLSQEQLFEKLQNYKKLLDNGLILQGEYDALKKEILSKM